MKNGCLYIVATPIGNLSDVTQRAIETLQSVALIAAEDTRHSQKLLNALGIHNRLVSLHDHNERTRSNGLVSRLLAGETIALISDAGTPMISDPGYHLVRAAQQAGVTVIPIPGPSAVISALSVSGLPANRFYFHGFLPEKAPARRATLEGLADYGETMVFFESARRITRSLEDMEEVFGNEREAVICRELTKLHETVSRDTLGQLRTALNSGMLEVRGEFVLLVAGAGMPDKSFDAQLARRLLAEFGDLMPAGKMASALARALETPRKEIYDMLLQMRGKEKPGE